MVFQNLDGVVGYVVQLLRAMSFTSWCDAFLFHVTLADIASCEWGYPVTPMVCRSWSGNGRLFVEAGLEIDAGE